VLQAEAAYLRDLGSRNGTFVNGARISMPHPLMHGDVIKLGGTTLIYRKGTSPAPTESFPRPAPVVHPVREETAVQAEVPAVAAPVSPAEKSMEASPAPEPVVGPVMEETPAQAEVPIVSAPEPPVEIRVAPSQPSILALVVRGGNLSGTTFQLTRSPMTLGRNPSSHIVIRHEATSWNHAVFKQEDMKWYVSDMGSSNGTRLNDTRLEPNQPYPLQVGDQLKFGETLLEVTQNAG
jgi:pSer/pThr/pTyr-binding forkhead associated (FHA) protein